MSSVIALIGDNCNVNQSVSNKLNIPLIGCSSHRLQLPVNDVLREHKTILKQVHVLMVKLRTPLISAKLRRVTHLKPKLRNDTRWSSKYQMIKKHVELCGHVNELGSEEVDDLVLMQSGERKVDQLLTQLTQLDHVTQKLQRHDATLRTAGAYFDDTLEEFSSL